MKNNHSAHAATGQSQAQSQSQLASPAPERWLSWNAWQSKRLDRIFAEARACTPIVRPLRPVNVTSFEFSFFEDLRTLEVGSDPSEFLDRARRRGVPREAAVAYWTNRASQKNGP